ncbi:MAG: hypothetical protein CSA62_09010 [Planctomycetota bacterium]|nr:MAG: hypothetical protein CSA62_09010 [Planctomycetota bacterium]
MSAQIHAKTRLAFAALLALPGLVKGQAPGARVPAELSTQVDAQELQLTGRAQLELAFTPRAKIAKPLLVRLELRSGSRRIWRQDHAPATPTTHWEPDRVVRYKIPLTLPQDSAAPDSAQQDSAAKQNLELWICFYDPRSKQQRPLSQPRSPRSGAFVKIGSWKPKGTSGSLSAEAVREQIKKAESWAKEGRQQAAWNLLTRTHRKLEDYELKAELRDGLLRVGRFAPRPIGPVESMIVEGRILEEKRRYVRHIAGRMLGQDKLHGALYLLKMIGGALEEGLGRAYIGDLNQVRRAQTRIEDVERRIKRRISPEQQAVVDAEIEKKGLTPRLLHSAKKYMQGGEYSIARRMLQALSRSPDTKLGSKSLALFHLAEKKLLAAMPTEEKREADAAWDHPAWARTKAIPSHEFIVIGPETLITSIPDMSKLRFDLAYLYLTDLFGRVPNPEGDRVTVYFKELWDFGGGVGGGKRIDIGKADPDSRKTKLDNGLLYHELVHCIDDTRPVLGGFREGLAEFGAAFVFEALGQRTPARWTYVHNLRAFQEDYLKRDLEYWRIPNYGPSAGFFLWFIENYGKKGQRRQWQLYRRFFRAYRSDAVRDGRSPSVVRALAYRLGEQFGPKVFDDLRRFRFPLRDSDRQALQAEQKEAVGEYLPEAEDFAPFPGSPVPRDVRAFELAEDRAPLGDWAARLGIITQWRAIGPFKDGHSDPGARVWPPEYEVDFSKTYDVPRNTALWKPPGPRPPIRLGPSGWLSFDWNYMENSAIYALTHLNPGQGTDARLWLRADDEVTIFVNDKLIGQYRGQQSPLLGPWRPGRGVMIADAIVFDTRLAPGRNKVLLKIRNRYGKAGVVLAVSDTAGNPIPGLVADNAAPARISHHLPDTLSGKWKRRLNLSFEKRGSARVFVVKQGGFRVRQQQLFGTTKNGAVPWRKYTVRPGFQRDAPSNFAWLHDRYTKELGDFRLTLGLLAKTRPKLALCFQGQGHQDPLSGWTLILHPDGKGLRARLERYGRLLYQSARVEWKQQEKGTPLRIELRESRCSVWLGKLQLFDQVPIREIAGKSAIGLATWNEATQLKWMRLETRG